MMRDELEDTTMQHKRYENIDGTGEMFFGLMLLGFALVGYLQTVLPEHSKWRTNIFGVLLLMYASLGLTLGLGFLVRRVIKKHITWPRTGYVAGHSLWPMMFAPKPDKNEVAPAAPARRAFWVVILAFALFSAVLGAGFALLVVFEMKGTLSLARVAYLALWAPLYAFWVFHMSREHHWKWLILFFMALGLVAIGLIFRGGFSELSQWVMSFLGLMWLISGGGTLCSYLRRTHSPAPVTE